MDTATLDVQEIVAAAARLREAIWSLPPLPEGSDSDLYGPELLRRDSGAVCQLLEALASCAESVRWLTLAARHVLSTPADLRGAGWPLAQRQCVAGVRLPVREAGEPSYQAAMLLWDAARRAGALDGLVGAGAPA